MLVMLVRRQAAGAQTLYLETERSPELRLKVAENKTILHFTALREDKPSEPNRRDITGFG
jgi:hypothetical protein